ncbi:unnamed protein product [Alopecurus aequalis]
MESIVAASVSQPGTSACPWASLPTDLLLDVSGRLHNARDFVRFHAVCRAWLDAAPSRAARHTFLPWIISQPNVNRSLMQSPVIHSGGISSEEHWRNRHLYDGNALPVWSFSETTWVASADGEAVWHFQLSPEPSLIDLVTRAVRSLPLFPDEIYEIKRRMKKPSGVVYADGTILLYSFVPEDDDRNYYGLKNPIFTGVVLRPGDMEWTIVEKRLDRPVEENSCATYHDGKILVWGTNYDPAHFLCIVAQDTEADGGGDIAGVSLEMTCDRNEQRRYMDNHSYVFESRGELFCASVLIEYEWLNKNTGAMYNRDFVVPPLEVRVHALEEDVDGNIGQMRWVERDGMSLADRVLFLGLPASFTMDATQLGTDGGCAYLVYWHRVFRYNLVDGKTQYVECPCPLRFISPKVNVWLQPQPAIAPIQEIQERLRLRQNKKERKKKKPSN